MVKIGEPAQESVATSVNTWHSDFTGLTRKAIFWSVRTDVGVHLTMTDNNSDMIYYG